MRRLLVTILCLLYMGSATGATIHIHYCMGKLMSAGFLHHDENEPCGNCGMKPKAKKGCCKDVHKTIKTADHQASKTNLKLSAVDVALIPAGTTVSPNAIYSAPFSGLIAAVHAPPNLWRTCPIYIEVCNFRI